MNILIVFILLLMQPGYPKGLHYVGTGHHKPVHMK